MNIGIIVVSYNTRELLHRCLSAVAASTSASRIPSGYVVAIVVDNASTDGSADMVATRHPDVRLIASSRNLGFTGANNLALAQLGFAAELPPGVEPPSQMLPSARPDYVLLLNSDAELTGDALGQMARFLQTTPSAGVCGAQLHYGDGRFQHGAFRFPSLFQVALDFFPLTGTPGVQRLHNSRCNGRYPARLWRDNTPFQVDFVLGAALMARGAAIAEVGGLDNEFFMYCEEIDWCMRMADAGWRIYAVPTARVIHHEGQSSRQVRWTAYVRLWRSRLRLVAKHPERYSRAYVVAMRGLIRAGTRWRMAQAHHRFACGEITGVELAAELSAYAEVMRLQP